ncbi:MAG TPA: NTP transferase domain-containing protein [Thermoanaerobaculia bacterium]|nr:NTP transferase domain-containing protein [Thermoanaerobaculia bacterium]
MISAIVLAAGQATRFGRCKQLVTVGGKALLDRALGNLRASKIDDIVVVLGAHAEEIRGQISFDGVRVVMNPDYAEGMSTSIQAGLRALPESAEAAMIVLGDQPFVTPRTLDLLVDEFVRARPKAIVPTYDGARGNPVIVSRALFGEMMNIRGDVGCRAVFGGHDVMTLPVDDRGVTMDIDTMEDLEMTPYVVATVVRAERPTSAKAGDKAIIAVDGTLTGWIGGSCSHDIVVRNALEALREGKPRFLSLSATTPGPRREGATEVSMQCYSGGALDIFIDPQLPKPKIVVVGSEPVARALARLAEVMQFQVTAVDEPRLPAFSEGDTSIVIATHGRYDEEAIEQAVRTNASYIALVASRKRAGAILEILRQRGIDVDRVKAPAGLDIGAKTAEEIALSILAEIVQQRRMAKMEATEPDMEAEAIDPICGMTVTIKGARHSLEHEGRRFYFCGAHCQRTFEQDPHRYAHVA